MANEVTLTWQLPAVTSRQRPIKQVEISYRVKASPALPWTIQDVVAPSSEQKLVFSDVAPGSYEYRAVIVDTGDARGADVFASAEVGFDPPGIVVNFGAVAA